MRIPLLLVLAGAAPALMAQMPTRSMIETHVKASYAAWASKDVEAIVRLDPPANGFGFRSLKARSAETPLSTYRETVKSFFDLMENFRIELNEMQTAVDGDIGLAWGFHTEDFKMKGRAPEKVRVRFTRTLKYERNGWRTLLYHRDIQKFDESGRPSATQ